MKKKIDLDGAGQIIVRHKVLEYISGHDPVEISEFKEMLLQAKSYLEKVKAAVENMEKILDSTKK